MNRRQHFLGISLFAPAAILLAGMVAAQSVNSSGVVLRGISAQRTGVAVTQKTSNKSGTVQAVFALDPLVARASVNRRGERLLVGAPPVAGVLDFIPPDPSDLLVLTQFTDAWVSRLQGGGFVAPAQLGFLGFRHEPGVNGMTLAGDFDGDGFTDLVTITADGEAWTATFDAPDAFSVPNKQSSGWRADPEQGHLVLAGDVNGDGLSDLMQLRPDGELVWAVNNAGALGEPTELQVTMLRHNPANGFHVFAHDVDGDGKTDLVQADNDAGTLGVARSLTTGFDALQPWSSDDWLHDPAAKAALHFGDFNGDAKADVLEVRDSQMRVALSTDTALGNAIDAGTVGFHDDPARGEGWWVFPGDVDQDGLDDLIQINEFGEAWVAKSLGAGTFSPPVREAQLGFHHKPEGTWQIFVGHARR